jgi:hypothetical protein
MEVECSSETSIITYLHSYTFLRSREHFVSFIFFLFLKIVEMDYSGRKITENLGNVAVRGGKRWKE